MKYTKHLINENCFNTQVLESIPKILMPFTLSVAIMGIVLMTGMIPLSVTADGYRSVKYQILLFERKHRIVRSVVRSKPYVFLEHRNKLIVHGIVHEVNQFTNVLKKIA